MDAGTLRVTEGKLWAGNLATADVFITNYPPDIAHRFQVRYEDIEPLNSRLIYAQITGYGEEGSDANKPGYDTTAYWARSGLV